MAVDVEAVVTWLKDHVLDHVVWLSDSRHEQAKTALDEATGAKPEEPAAAPEAAPEAPSAPPAEPPPPEPPADQPTPPEAV